MEKIKPMIYDLLLETLRQEGQTIQGIYERNDIQVRSKEGLPMEKGFWGGVSLPTTTVIQENGLKLNVDIENGHFVRIGPEIAAHYPMEEQADMSYAPRKIAFREEKERLEPISVPKAFIDTNQHMNNAQYIRTALEFVPEDFHIRQVRVEYKKAAVLHDQLYPFIYKDDQIIKILLGDAEGQAYAVVEFKR